MVACADDRDGEERGLALRRAVFSELGRGTDFELYLPLAEGALQAASIAPSILRGSGLILLVDDEPLVRATAEHLLRSLGYDVLVAKDGAEAVLDPSVPLIVCSGFRNDALASPVGETQAFLAKP